MKTFELFIEDVEMSGVEAISIVEDPAIEEDFITLSSEKLKFAKVDGEKRILNGSSTYP